MRLLKWLTGSVSGLMLISCVTINIYFPAAAAEKAADKIIEDVWGADATTAAEPESNQSSMLTEPQSVAVTVLNWLVPPAMADGANIDINSPAINALQSKMKTRHNQLKGFYESGAVGLTENGLIAIHDAKVIALKDRNLVSGLVSDENNDRKALYAEIARANGHPEWQDDIQQTFAKRWVSNAANGWWYQQDGGWKQK